MQNKTKINRKKFIKTITTEIRENKKTALTKQKVWISEESALPLWRSVIKWKKTLKILIRESQSHKIAKKTIKTFQHLRNKQPWTEIPWHSRVQIEIEKEEITLIKKSQILIIEAGAKPIPSVQVSDDNFRRIGNEEGPKRDEGQII